MLTCQLALNVYMLMCLLTCQHVLFAHMLMCQYSLWAHVPTCLACLHTHMPTCILCLHVHVQMCFTCFCTHLPTCLVCLCTSRVNMSCVPMFCDIALFLMAKYVWFPVVRGKFRICDTYKMDVFAKVVYNLKLLTILRRSSNIRSIMGCWICLDYFFRFS